MIFKLVSGGYRVIFRTYLRLSAHYDLRHSGKVGHEINYATSRIDSIAATHASGSISQNRVDNRREI
jgi:hypothetical protein